MTQSSVQLLKDARAIIVERGWTQDAWARNSTGESVSATDPDAVCFCLSGALNRAAFEAGVAPHACNFSSGMQEALGALRVETRVTVAAWNDERATTVEAVVELLDRAIAASGGDA